MGLHDKLRHIMLMFFSLLFKKKSRFLYSLTWRYHAKFTLVELLIVISIVIILAGLLLPALGKAKMTAQQIQCQGRLKGMAVASMNYVSDYNDFLPVSYNMAIFSNCRWYHSPLMGQYLKASFTGKNIEPGISIYPEAYCTALVTNSLVTAPKNLLLGWQMNVCGYYFNGTYNLFVKYGAIKIPSMKICGGDAQEDSYGNNSSSDTSMRDIRIYVHMGKVNLLFLDGHADCGNMNKVLSFSAAKMFLLN